MKASAKLIGILLSSAVVAACGGGGGGGSDPLDTSVDYDIEKALFGTPGDARTLSGSGSDAGGDQWTIDWVLTTLISLDPSDPCLVGELQQDSSLTLTEQFGTVLTAAGPSCWTTSGLIQNTFDLDQTDSPEQYSVLTTAGTVPLTARIGDGGLAGIWNRFEDSNGDDTYDGPSGSDNFIGSSTTNWKLEDQNGKAALVFSTVLRDEFGVQEASETDTFFIQPSGTMTGFKITFVLAGGAGDLTLSGDVN